MICLCRPTARGGQPVDPVEIQIVAGVAVLVAATEGWCLMTTYQAAHELIQTFAQGDRLIPI
jgi:hypothetical protein